MKPLRRWPIIRHLRYLHAAWHFWGWWERIGSFYWLEPNPLDLAYLRAIWRGTDDDSTVHDQQRFRRLHG